MSKQFEPKIRRGQKFSNSFEVIEALGDSFYMKRRGSEYVLVRTTGGSAHFAHVETLLEHSQLVDEFRVKVRVKAYNLHGATSLKEALRRSRFNASSGWKPGELQILVSGQRGL